MPLTAVAFLTPMDRLLVILDLDETLVHSPDAPLGSSPTFHVGPHQIYARPHLDLFLVRLFARFRVAVWTAAGRTYASGVLARILPPDASLAFFWAAERCTQRFDHETRQYFTVKKLRKVEQQGFDLARVVVVDDSPEKHRLNYGNLVPVTPFVGDPADSELPDLLAYLESIEAVPNVRGIEKRNWRAEAQRRLASG